MNRMCARELTLSDPLLHWMYLPCSPIHPIRFTLSSLNSSRFPRDPTASRPGWLSTPWRLALTPSYRDITRYELFSRWLRMVKPDDCQPICCRRDSTRRLPHLGITDRRVPSRTVRAITSTYSHRGGDQQSGPVDYLFRPCTCRPSPD